MYENWGSYVAAALAGGELGAGRARRRGEPEARASTLTGFGDDRVFGYAALRAETPRGAAPRDARAGHPLRALHLAEDAGDAGGRSTTTRSSKAQLGEAFRSAAPVAGFAHVATLPLAEELHRDPVQVYRLAEEGPG